MAYEAKVLADSLSPDGVRLTTFEVTFPRLVLAEFNTHRVFSRNSASSRAIPVKTMLQRIQDDPFVPIHWGKNQKGMQADEELCAADQAAAKETWLADRDHAVYRVNQLLALGVHKQITNRLLEPWLWQTVIVTATEWDNWWGLRCNKDAQPEIRRIADMMLAAYEDGRPTPVTFDGWHLPLVTDKQELLLAGFSMDDVVKVCVGRCARVSYLTHDGKRDPKADIYLATRLRASGHMSPWEHAARPMLRPDAERILRKPGVCGIDTLDIDRRSVFSGNFRGWMQARKEIPNEANFLLTQNA